MSNALRKLRLKFDGIHKMVYGKESNLEMLKVNSIRLIVFRKE